MNLLTMIENADPNDSAMLDEIDFLANLYVNSEKITVTNGRYYFNKSQWAVEKGFVNSPNFYREEKWIELPNHFVCGEFYKYTRSRDALKAIRPEGWDLNVYVDYTGGNHSLNQWIANKYIGDNIPRKLVRLCTPVCQTEELAELHAIIQAIQYERGEHE